MPTTCAVCSEPVDATERHVAVTRQVESERRRAVTVHDADVLAHAHRSCADRLVVDVHAALTGR